MSAYLARLISGETYRQLRNWAKQLAKILPKAWERRAARAEEYTRGFWTGGTLFEEMGFYYVGPIDGHNFDHLLPVLRNVRDTQNGVCVIGDGAMELEVRIERLGAQADGLAQGPDGPLFVPFTLSRPSQECPAPRRLPSSSRAPSASLLSANISAPAAAAPSSTCRPRDSRRRYAGSRR